MVLSNKKMLEWNTFKFFKYEMSEIRVILLSERSKCSRWIFWDKESIVQIRFPESPSQVNSFRSFNPSIVDKQLCGRFNIFKWCSLATCNIRTSRLFCAESYEKRKQIIYRSCFGLYFYSSLSRMKICWSRLPFLGIGKYECCQAFVNSCYREAR